VGKQRSQKFNPIPSNLKLIFFKHSLRGTAMKRITQSFGRFGLFFFCIVLISHFNSTLPARAQASAPPVPGIQPDQIYNKAGDAFEKGNYEEAIAYWESALATYDNEKNALKKIDVLSKLALSYQFIGYYSKSLEKLDAAQVLLNNTKDKNRSAILYKGYGQSCYLTGDFLKSQEHYSNGLSIARETGNAELTAEILNNYGNLMAVQSRFPEALKAYNESVEQAQKANKPDLAITARVNSARAYTEQGKFLEAKALLDDSLEKIDGTRDTGNKVFDLIAIGRLYTRIYVFSVLNDTKLLNNSYAALTRAVETAEKLNNRKASSYAMGYLGSFYEQARRYDDALLLTHQAILAAQEANAIESQYRWYWQKGHILRKQGNIDESVNAYRHALKNFAVIRQDISADCTKRARLSFRETVGPVYFELADILLERSSSQKEPAQVKNDLIEARNTIEQLKTAELQDYFHDDCLAALKSKTKNLDQIIQKSAVIYFVILPNRIELLVSTPGGLKQFSAPVSTGALNNEVNTLRSKLEKLSDTHLPNAQQLYNWLIRPLEKTLADEQVDTLIFVPDGMLRTIPMGLLHDGNRFLVTRYTLVTTPGLTLTDPHPIAKEKTRLLLGGISDSVQGFSALPSVTAELNAIQKFYDSVVFLNGDFNNANLDKTMKETPYTIVHIASHGQFDSDPAKTFLLTYNEKLSMNQLEKMMGYGRYRGKPVELLTLSACQTAVGDDRAALGLAGVAIKAGARSALASLWSVNDEATSRLMIEFYSQLKDPANSKAQALQKAQNKLLEDAKFSHPAYWAPFILIGNWM
jgi:CHAT domain-containing protein